MRTSEGLFTRFKFIEMTHDGLGLEFPEDDRPWKVEISEEGGPIVTLYEHQINGLPRWLANRKAGFKGHFY